MKPIHVRAAGALSVLGALAVPAVADAHPSVFGSPAQVETAPGTFEPQMRYVVANHGFTYVLRESNGDTGGGVFDYKSIPTALRAGKDWAWLIANGTTGAQAHAQCELPELETEAAIRSWQGADPFYGYVPFQPASAGLEDDPATWIPVVERLTGVDLATEPDPKGACEEQGGTYVPADATQTSNAAFNAGLVEQTAAPLEAEVASATAARDALQRLLAAARAEIARLTAGTAALRVALPSARLVAKAVARRGVTAALTGAPGTAVKAHLTIGERRARRLGLRSSVLASAQATVGADGRAAVVLKPGAKAGRTLRGLDRAIAITVRARAGDRIATTSGTLAR